MTTSTVEANLVVTDAKGNPVAMWRKHPKLRTNILYKLKEMTLKEIENFGSELYTNNTLIAKAESQNG